jgi:hypothetical protein
MQREGDLVRAVSKNVLCFTISALVILNVGLTSSYTLIGLRWQYSPVTYLSYSGYTESLSAVESWNAVSNCKFRADYAHAVSEYRTYRSDVAWDGLTTWTGNGQYFTSALIYLNDYYLRNYNSIVRQGVIAHEYGHVQGLGHSVPGTLMVAYTDQRGSICTPQEDDINGVRYLYG